MDHVRRVSHHNPIGGAPGEITSSLGKQATPTSPIAMALIGCYLLLLTSAHSWTIGASSTSKTTRGGRIALQTPQEALAPQPWQVATA